MTMNEKTSFSDHDYGRPFFDNFGNGTGFGCGLGANDFNPHGGGTGGGYGRGFCHDVERATGHGEGDGNCYHYGAGNNINPGRDR